MTQIRIEQLTLRAHGISAETARAALQGLDAELLKRLDPRALDALAARELAPSIRLPAIETGMALDAESLRARIADALVAFLSAAAAAEPAEER